MKRNNRILWIAGWITAIFFVGCTTDYPTYDVSQKTGLYYSNGTVTALNDTMRLDSKVTDDTTTRYFNFTILGIPVDYDREIAVEFLESNLAKEKYGIKNHVLKAGAVTTSIAIEMYNDASQEGTTGYIAFRVVDNEHFNVIRELSPTMHLFNTVVGQQKPKWWRDDIFGPFSLELYKRVVITFVSLSESNPELYAVMSESLGDRLQNEPYTIQFIPPWFVIEVYTGEMWGKFKFNMMKYVVAPVYEYYQENPTEGINVPNPNVVE